MARREILTCTTTTTTCADGGAITNDGGVSARSSVTAANPKKRQHRRSIVALRAAFVLILTFALSLRSVSTSFGLLNDVDVAVAVVETTPKTTTSTNNTPQTQQQQQQQQKHYRQQAEGTGVVVGSTTVAATSTATSTESSPNATTSKETEPKEDDRDALHKSSGAIIREETEESAASSTSPLSSSVLIDRDGSHSHSSPTLPGPFRNGTLYLLGARLTPHSYRPSSLPPSDEGAGTGGGGVYFDLFGHPGDFFAGEADDDGRKEKKNTIHKCHRDRHNISSTLLPYRDARALDLRCRVVVASDDVDHDDDKARSGDSKGAAQTMEFVPLASGDVNQAKTTLIWRCDVSKWIARSDLFGITKVDGEKEEVDGEDSFVRVEVLAPPVPLLIQSDKNGASVADNYDGNDEGTSMVVVLAVNVPLSTLSVGHAGPSLWNLDATLHRGRPSHNSRSTEEEGEKEKENSQALPPHETNKEQAEAIMEAEDGMQTKKNPSTHQKKADEHEYDGTNKVILCTSRVQSNGIRYLPEFVQHHLNVGIYQVAIGLDVPSLHHPDVDRAYQVLQPFVDAGQVSIGVHGDGDDLACEWTGKMHFYHGCLYHAKGLAEYVVFWDNDEYWTPPPLLPSSSSMESDREGGSGSDADAAANVVDGNVDEGQEEGDGGSITTTTPNIILHNNPYRRYRSLPDVARTLRGHDMRHNIRHRDDTNDTTDGAVSPPPPCPDWCHLQFQSYIVHLTPALQTQSASSSDRTGRLGLDFHQRERKVAKAWGKSIARTEVVHMGGMHLPGSCHAPSSSSSVLSSDAAAGGGGNVGGASYENDFYQTCRSTILDPDAAGSMHHFMNLFLVRRTPPNKGEGDSLVPDEYVTEFAPFVSGQLDRLYGIEHRGGLAPNAAAAAAATAGKAAADGALTPRSDSNITGTNKKKTDYKHYVLGDVFKLAGLQTKEKFEKEVRRQRENFPHSIAHLYLLEVGGPRHGIRNMTALLRAIDRRKEESQVAPSQGGAAAVRSPPGKDTLVVHLRLGDTLSQRYLINVTRPVLDLWEHGDFVCSTGIRYNYNRIEFERLLAKVPRNVTRAVVVGSDVHANNANPRHADRNRQYVAIVESFLRERGFTVSLKGNDDDPDDDFMYMTSASWLLVGMGGYAQLAARLVELRGGRAFFTA